MNGNLSLSARTLKQCVGYEWVSREYLSKYVNADDRLRALWREARDPLTDLEPIAGKKLELGLANIDEQQRDKLIKHRKERFEAAGILRDIGLGSEEIATYLHGQELSSQHFQQIGDAAHGIAAVQLLKLTHRMKEIEQDYLKNSEETVFITDEGNVVNLAKEGEAPRYLMVPKVSTREKLVWQREWTALANEARKVKADIDKGMLVALEAVRVKNEGTPKPKKKAVG